VELLLTSPWIPPEWIKAHGLEPRGIWALPDTARRGQGIALGAGVCAFADSVTRCAEDASGAAVVYSSHCDQLRRGYDTVAARNAPRHFLFNLPATWQTETADTMFRCELERLGRFLESMGGAHPTLARLEEWIALYDQARRGLIEAATVCPARAYAESIARFHWNGRVQIPAPVQPSREAKPVALVGGPLPRDQWGLLEEIERQGGRVVLNATENGERSLEPPRPVRPKPAPESESAGAEWAAVALGFARRVVDVYQRPNTRLYAWLAERLSARGARGIILWHYVGCDLWRAEARSLREAFDMPVLALDADETPNGQARNAGRVQAFLETL
jgi:benzoyl-CoA reductase/2-hydroxyglutaryl-CoA dehydratase subunit BcrC/BadD/HgdB